MYLLLNTETDWSFPCAVFRSVSDSHWLTTWCHYAMCTHCTSVRR